MRIDIWLSRFSNLDVFGYFVDNEKCIEGKRFIEVELIC